MNSLPPSPKVRHDMRAAGVHFETAAATEGAATGRSLIVVTPDAQRTMQTFLGASVDLTPDVSSTVIERSPVLASREISRTTPLKVLSHDLISSSSRSRRSC